MNEAMAIYRKTTKGMDELMARRRSIDLRLNSVLILVDGKRSTRDILKSLEIAGMPMDALDMLLHGKYIEELPEQPPVVAATSAVDFSVSALPTQSIQAKAKAPVTVPSVQEPVREPEAVSEFQVRYAWMVRKSKELLGLRGFMIQLQLEKAQTLEALHELVGPLSEAIAKRHGLEVANEFLRKSALLTVRVQAKRGSLTLISGKSAVQDIPEPPPTRWERTRAEPQALSG